MILKNKHKARTMKKLLMQMGILLLVVTACSTHKEKWENIRIENADSPKNDIRSICFDQEGKMWVGTWFGVFENVDGQWEAQGPESYVETLFIGPDDTKWAGLWGGGVYKCVVGGQWENVKEASPTNSVNVISADNKGSIWVGDWGGGAVNLDGKGEIDVNNKTGGAANFNGSQWVVYKDEDVNLGDNSVVAIACDTQNRMWFGTYHGLSRLDKGVWTLFNKQNSQLPDNDVYSLASDSKDNIWVGTCNGLAKLSGESWIIFKKENCGLVDNLIFAIAEDADGNIWVGTNKGVSVFDGSKWKTYTSDNSQLIDNRVQVIKVSGKKVYLGTGKGISVFEK